MSAGLYYSCLFWFAVIGFGILTFGAWFRPDDVLRARRESVQGDLRTERRLTDEQWLKRMRIVYTVLFVISAAAYVLYLVMLTSGQIQ